MDVCKASMKGTATGLPRKTALHGLWYVTVSKEGARYQGTSFKPWVHYSPHMGWLGGLWDAKKLSHAQKAILLLSLRLYSASEHH